MKLRGYSPLGQYVQRHLKARMIEDGFTHIGIGCIVEPNIGFRQGPPVKCLFQDAMVIKRWIQCYSRA